MFKVPREMYISWLRRRKYPSANFRLSTFSAGRKFISFSTQTDAIMLMRLIRFLGPISGLKANPNTHYISNWK